MKILLTLDYELFLGEKTGSVERSLVFPMRKMLEQTEELGVKYTLFADAAYLYRLQNLAGEYPSLASDLRIFKQELQALVRSGHDVQLHIHPQWYYSTFDGKEWLLDKEHYKLSDIPNNEVSRLFKESKEVLDGVVGYKTHAFRAGGFSAQPFDKLKPLFVDNGITMDSSVCPGTKYESDYQRYDYMDCPNASKYQFEDNLTSVDDSGQFTEIPITMYAISPLFYWQLVLMRLIKDRKHSKMGDGDSVKTSRDSIVDRLTRKALSLSTIDGLKVKYLYQSLQNAVGRGDDLFCVIGHPKLATPYSIEAMGAFCRRAVKDGHSFITISQL